ncbi:MAG: ThuA domain-containing protein [Planctomycetaceae bacterium]|nr:ThuA domain-containing protein [Planctomycetaceae bacterium]
MNLKFSIALAVAVMTISISARAEEKVRWVTYEGQNGPGHGKQVVLISGDEEYRSEEAFPMLGKLLAERHGFTCTVLFSQDPETTEIDPNNQTNIPGMQHLENADLVILGLRFRELPDKEMKYFDEYFKAGKPFIALRTSTHAFNYSRHPDSPYAKYDWRAKEPWKGGFGQAVLGETWVSHHGHHGRESTRGVINKKHADHPILKGVDDVWGPTDVYGVTHLPDDATVLMYGQVLSGMKPNDPPNEEKKMMPLVWTREYPTPGGKSKILTTTMGAAVDFLNEDQRRLVVNGTYWATGLTDQITADLNVKPVGDYNPTFFGFNKFKKGVFVKDHQ